MSFFAGKVVIVTGSSNGIGRGTAELFAKAGAKITITGRNADTLGETHELCIKAGAKQDDILRLIGDVTDEAFVEQLVTKTVEKFGQLDVLVNNAGASIFDMTGKKGLDVPLANYDRIMDINVRSVVKISQLAVPHLEKTKGAIVNVSSIAGFPFAAQEAYYSMSKAALDQLTVQMAGQLILKEIRVNSVNPGAILTNFAVTAGAPKELLQEGYAKMFANCTKVIPLGKIGQADDIGKIILFLADRSQSEIIVGQRIVADGGSVLRNCLFSVEMFPIFPPQETEGSWCNMTAALGISPIIGITVVLCHSVTAMRYEKGFLENSWSNLLNETIEHITIQATSANDFIATHNGISLDEKSHSDSYKGRSARHTRISGRQNATYETRFEMIHETFRDPDHKLFTVRISDKLTGEKFYVGLPSRDQLRAFQWSRGTAYSFVLDDHVYYVPSPEKQPIRVSTQEEGLLHGTFDWVRSGAMWFSKSGKYLAYASRAANSSKKMMITTYTKAEQYDYNYNMEYPKTREPRLATYTVSIWSVEEQNSTKMEVQLRDNKAFHYLFGVSWVTLHGKELLLATWANRWQNETSLTLCSYETATCSLIYEHKYAQKQWASPEDYAKRPDFQLESMSFLSSGEYDITEVVTYRQKEDLVFYRAQAPQPWNMHVYAVAAGNTLDCSPDEKLFQTNSVLKGDKCLTCDVSNCTFQSNPIVLPGENVAITFSCAGPGPSYRAKVSFDEALHCNGTNIIRPPNDFETQSEWIIDTFLLPSGFEAHIKIYLGDAQLDSVPVTLAVYGGPDMNMVTDQFEWIPDDKRAIVYIDVRGSGARGWKYRSPIYGRLVTVEVEDTVEAMKMVLAKYPKLDKNRVGVDGWSYGGTMVLALVEKAPDAFFKCTFAGAPVTNFLNYDATYTERYMADAPRSSYTDLTQDVSKFKQTQLLLVHGMRDDNVHFQNSALLIEALQKAAIPFRLMVYPNQDHGVVSEHLHNMKESFFNACYA